MAALTVSVPACIPAAALTVTVDGSHTVDEYNFANNTLTIPCPASAANHSTRPLHSVTQ